MPSTLHVIRFFLPTPPFSFRTYLFFTLLLLIIVYILFLGEKNIFECRSCRLKLAYVEKWVAAIGIPRRFLVRSNVLGNKQFRFNHFLKLFWWDLTWWDVTLRKHALNNFQLNEESLCLCWQALISSDKLSWVDSKI